LHIVSVILLVLEWISFVVATAVIAWVATAIIRPWLIRRATVYPNARSGHLLPTPQGGGVAVVVVMLVAAFAALAYSGTLPSKLTTHAAAVASGALALMIIGLIDDIRSLPIMPRLAVQALAVGAIVATLPPDMRVMPGHLSIAIERGLVFFGGLWFVNLYNFMDGVDMMSVTETVAIAFGISLLALLGLVPAWIGWVAAALIGAMVGFAPWNMLPARLFLGDTGSLTIGLIVGTLLVHVAGAYALPAALILPLYYLIDASITVIRRVVRVRRFWEPHRDHFYQMATRNGYSVGQIVKYVVALDAVLIVLAVIATYFRDHTAAVLVPIFVGVISVLVLLRNFSISKS
jgi:UDP-N-acetylmuramyl pentapeptide phosphotransferase/UDP-N-acetylglucosamine-1-phosphate transferase